jgi:hypothetical protein
MGLRLVLIVAMGVVLISLTLGILLLIGIGFKLRELYKSRKDT